MFRNVFLTNISKAQNLLVLFFSEEPDDGPDEMGKRLKNINCAIFLLYKSFAWRRGLLIIVSLHLGVLTGFGKSKYLTGATLRHELVSHPWVE